jgi:uncharacterized protein (DUF302 family)
MTSSAAPTDEFTGVVSFRSPYAFDDTVRRLLKALADHGIKVFTTIDQQAEALAVGLSMPPTTLILFGNPKGGTPLMLANPLSGIDLPLKALVIESPKNEVDVIINSTAYIIGRHSLPAQLAANLTPAERLIASTLGH